MSDWSLSSFLMALLVAIFVPALIIHFTLGRNGGHHLFKDMPKDKVKDLPLEMLRSRLRHQFHGSFATLIGLGVTLALYPLACKLGFPLNIFEPVRQTTNVRRYARETLNKWCK